MVNRLGLLTFLLFLPATAVFADVLVISGKVLNESTNEPIEFGNIIIPEVKFKSRINPDGTYSAAVPAAGEYTVTITAPGYKTYVEKIALTQNLKRDFRIALPLTRVQTVKIRSERDIQSLSRNTLSVEQLKETPATFGDAINALATLPGVVRPGVFLVLLSSARPAIRPTGTLSTISRSRTRSTSADCNRLFQMT